MRSQSWADDIIQETKQFKNKQDEKVLSVELTPFQVFL